MFLTKLFDYRLNRHFIQFRDYSVIRTTAPVSKEYWKIVANGMQLTIPDLPKIPPKDLTRQIKKGDGIKQGTPIHNFLSAILSHTSCLNNQQKSQDSAKWNETQLIEYIYSRKLDTYLSWLENVLCYHATMKRPRKEPCIMSWGHPWLNKDSITLLWEVLNICKIEAENTIGFQPSIVPSKNDMLKINNNKCIKELELRKYSKHIMLKDKEKVMHSDPFFLPIVATFPIKTNYVT